MASAETETKEDNSSYDTPDFGVPKFSPNRKFIVSELKSNPELNSKPDFEYEFSRLIYAFYKVLISGTKYLKLRAK